jgi:hypothetical protein
LGDGWAPVPHYQPGQGKARGKDERHDHRQSAGLGVELLSC